MTQLWGGRFTKETDQLVYNFNASISFDRRLYAQDIRGSIAHVMMLAKQGILTDADKEKIIEGLEGILSDLEKGKIEIPDTYEDIVDASGPTMPSFQVAELVTGADDIMDAVGPSYPKELESALLTDLQFLEDALLIEGKIGSTTVAE